MHGKNVLIVEDDPVIRELLSTIVEESGGSVLAVETAAEGIALLSHDSWGAVITDVCTPGAFDGWDLAWTVHKQQPGLRVVVTSGGSNNFAKPLPPCASFLAKPWSIDQLVAALAGD